MAISISFRTLKQNYRTEKDTVKHSCESNSLYKNTCALRMSEALIATEPTLLAIFQDSKKNVCSHGYIRGAQQLGAVLAYPKVLGKHSKGWSKPSAYSHVAPGDAAGLQGIIMYATIPGYDGEGHIDLLENGKAVGSSYWDAKTIWFWKIL